MGEASSLHMTQAQTQTQTQTQAQTQTQTQARRGEGRGGEHYGVGCMAGKRIGRLSAHGSAS